VTLPAFAAECQRLVDGAVQPSIDISCCQGAKQQTRCKPPLLAIDGTDRRMYRLQTYCHCLYDRFIKNKLYIMKFYDKK